MRIDNSKAGKDDRPAVYQLSLLLNKDDKTKTPKEIEASVSKALERGLVWIAKADNKIVGYVLCELFDETKPSFPNSIFISELYVADAFRKLGVGRKLVQMALSSKFPKKYTYFSITHDPGSPFLTDLYKSLGFEEKGLTDAGNIKLTKQI